MDRQIATHEEDGLTQGESPLPNERPAPNNEEGLDTIPDNFLEEERLREERKQELDQQIDEFNGRFHPQDEQQHQHQEFYENKSDSATTSLAALQNAAENQADVSVSKIASSAPAAHKQQFDRF